MRTSRIDGHVLSWLAGWETDTVAVVAALLHRARVAAPLPAGGHEPERGGW